MPWVHLDLMKSQSPFSILHLHCLLPNLCFLMTACILLESPLALRGVALLKVFSFPYSETVLSVIMAGVWGPGVRGGNLARPSPAELSSRELAAYSKREGSSSLEQAVSLGHGRLSS